MIDGRSEHAAFWTVRYFFVPAAISLERQIRRNTTQTLIMKLEIAVWADGSFTVWFLEVHKRNTWPRAGYNKDYSDNGP